VGEEVVGYIEIETLEDAGRLPRHGGLADIGNLHICERHRRRAAWADGWWDKQPSGSGSP
jgi:hypothetical protein